MAENVRTALDLGYMRVAEDLLVRPSDVRSLPRNKVLVLASGSQGEPQSAMSQIAIGNHKHVVIEPGDAVPHLNRALALEKLDRPQDALASYRKALELATTDQAALADKARKRIAALAGR